jgi:hypothetical protein
MFSFFKDKGAAKSETAVHADVGALLVRQQNFPAKQPTSTSAPAPRQLALDGVPPQASLLDQAIAGQTTTAYLIEASAGHPPLALVNISGAQAHIELWELAAGDKPVFARKRAVRLDSAQDSWSAFLLSDVAHLPGNRLLVAVFYYAPQVKQALFQYDIAANSFTKIANVVPHHTVDQQKFFAAQLVAPETVIVQYYTSSIRLAPEVYYNTPSHLRLFSPRYPQGVEILQLSAADGGIERWTVIDRMLWIHSRDPRERGKPKDFVWSLNLEKVLSR